ncbi:MAG: hypothetical protein Q7W13_01665 [Bacteroidia bacterium]|nr:hypothetical protein [Bacteroidia bacterium]
MSKTITISLSIIFVIILVYSCRMCQYKKTLEKVSEEMYNEIYLNNTFKGKIKKLEPYHNKTYEYIMTIDTEEEEFDLDYAILCVDENFVSFVEKGDSVYKTGGSKTVKFCKKDKSCKDIELKFCGGSFK